MTDKIGNHKIFILIHGAWQASWCWYKIVNLLRKFGHHIITPDLPGHSQDIENFYEININNYVNYIINLIETMPNSVILIGHSMAGIILTLITEIIPEKVEKLIYISGFIPQNGHSIIEEEKNALFPGISLKVKIDIATNSIILNHNSPSHIKELLYNECDNEDIEYALSKLQNQPLQPFLAPITFSEKNFGYIEKYYIECTEDKAISIADQRRMNSKLTKCKIISIDSDHSPFFSKPELLTEILHKIGQD